MANEYTPTVWRTGDIITAEKLNKIEEGIANAGKVIYTTVFDDSVTTEASGHSFATATINNELPVLWGDSILVTFEGVEYLIPKVQTELGYNYGEESQGSPSFINYPVLITGDGTIVTESAGTYNIKIKMPDISEVITKAEVTITNQLLTGIQLKIPSCSGAGMLPSVFVEPGITKCFVPLLMSTAIMEIPEDCAVTNLTGDISNVGFYFQITGDCGLTLTAVS